MPHLLQGHRQHLLRFHTVFWAHELPSFPLLGEEAAILRGEMTCLVLLSQEEAGLGSELRFLLGTH